MCDGGWISSLLCTSTGRAGAWVAPAHPAAATRASRAARMTRHVGGAHEVLQCGSFTAAFLTTPYLHSQR